MKKRTFWFNDTDHWFTIQHYYYFIIDAGENIGLYSTVISRGDYNILSGLEKEAADKWENGGIYKD